MPIAIPVPSTSSKPIATANDRHSAQQACRCAEEAVILRRAIVVQIS